MLKVNDAAHDATLTASYDIDEAVRQSRPARVGRYEVGEALGSGAMGVVYRARDPELDRAVAIKLVRSGSGCSSSGVRLLREAQAMARLRHPNVVPIFDVGPADDAVFVAMPLLEGGTLRSWLRGGPHPLDEILDRFVAAGRGLAAAHAAGLVHRDFKPDNVLLGDDGRVRVVDFGLARPAGIETDEGDGVILGTPAYMAPEQLRGAPADAQSDQYGFCVALWEALYGKRPGDTSPSEGASRTPLRLRQVLVRGLSADPAARYPSTDALLAVLGRDPWLLRRRLLAAAAVLLVAGAAGLGWQRSRQALCSGGEERVAALWNAPRKQVVHAAFAATRAPYAESSWATVGRAFDRYFADWAKAHREACEATRVRGEQSEELLDRRMSCLDQQLRQTVSLVDVFAHADAGLVKRAVDVSRKLAAVDECSDTAALLASASRPKDPAARRRLTLAEGRLARAQALSDAGRNDVALRDLDGIAAEARAVAYRPLEARALYLKGYAQTVLGHSHEAEVPLFDAILAAEASSDRVMIGLAASQLARTVGYMQSRREEGHRWARFAQSSIEGIQGNTAVQVRLLNLLGPVLQRDGLYAEGVATYRRALALAESGLGSENALTASVLSNLGVALLSQGRYEEALQVSLRGLAMYQRTLAPDHPELGYSYNTVGGAYTELGRKEEALAMYRKAWEIFAAAYGEAHPMTASAVGNYGIALKDLGRYQEALESYRKSLAAFQMSEPDGPSTGIALANIGELLLIEKRYAEALPSYQRALAIDEKLFGPTHPEFSYALRGVGEALMGSGRTRDAVPLIERALGIQESAHDVPEQIAKSRYTLAQALWTQGDHGRALRLAHQAYRTCLDTRGESTKEMAADVQGWLRARGQTP